jgi:hypothetical protein
MKNTHLPHILLDMRTQQLEAFLLGHAFTPHQVDEDGVS